MAEKKQTSRKVKDKLKSKLKKTIPPPVDTGKFWGTGRRKEAVARVYLCEGKGKVTINHRDINDYFCREFHRFSVTQPLKVTDTLDKYNVVANVNGGGITGQAEAVGLGIARALVRADDSLRGALKHKGLITRDPRMKERKKYGQRGARKRFQWTKR